MNTLAAQITRSLFDGQNSLAGILAQRPYVNDRGQSVISVPTGQLTDKGEMVFSEQAIHTNATLRKDEWLRIDDTLIESARERLVIVDDLMSAGLTYNTGGIGVQIAEWENSSEITDADVDMDGESKGQQDRQEFGLNGVPIPVIHKEFRIGARTLAASRTRGASLDVTTGIEAARAVARTSENLVFNGGYLGAVKSANNTYRIYGLTNFPSRATRTIADWGNVAVTPETILDDILGMVSQMETDQRKYGPFTLYIPAEFSFRFYADYKAFGDKTLMERVLADPRIAAVKVSDVLSDNNVVMLEMDVQTIDLAVGSDITTVQWQSPSGWTNAFQTFALWAPRLKTDYDGRTGILHATSLS